MPRPATSDSSTAQASMTFEIVPFATDALLTVSPPVETMPANVTSEQITHRYTSAAPPPQLNVEEPTCFGRVNGGYSCLGKLWNRTEHTVGSVSLKVEILDSNNQTLTEQSLIVEQSIIPSNTFASYRVLFDPFYGEKAEIRTTIMQQLPTSYTQSPLTIANERGLLMESGRYRLTATIENDLDTAVDNIRIFATLINPTGDVVGYRIYEVNESIQATERRAVDFEVIPQVYESYISHILHVEGHIEGSELSTDDTNEEDSNIQP